MDVEALATMIRMNASHDDLTEAEAFAVAQEIVDMHVSELESGLEAMRCEISVRQGELDDIAELVRVQRDAPFGAVRDRVAELARGGDQLRMST